MVGVGLSEELTFKLTWNEEQDRVSVVRWTSQYKDAVAGVNSARWEYRNNTNMPGAQYAGR